MTLLNNFIRVGRWQLRKEWWFGERPRSFGRHSRNTEQTSW